MLIVPNLLNILFTIYAVGIPAWRIFHVVHIDAVFLFAFTLQSIFMHKEIMFVSGHTSLDIQFVQMIIILIRTCLRTVTRFSNYHSTIKSVAWMGDVCYTCLLIIPLYTCVYPYCPSCVPDCRALEMPINYVYLTWMYVSFQLAELIMQSLSQSWQSRVSRHVFMFVLAATHEYVVHDMRTLIERDSQNITYTYQA